MTQTQASILQLARLAQQGAQAPRMDSRDIDSTSFQQQHAANRAAAAPVDPLAGMLAGAVLPLVVDAIGAQLAERLQVLGAALSESTREALQQALAGVQASVDPAKLRDAARAALTEEIVDPATRAAALAAGLTELAPPVLPVEPDYQDTDTGRMIAHVLRQGAPFALVSGPSGSGKTYPIEMELRKAGRRYVKVSCADGLTRGELVGRQEAAGGSTRWVDGHATRCARHGYVLILDEIGKLDALTLASIQPLLDRNPSILTPWGERVDAVAGYAAFGTCNALTDETGLYVEQAVSADLPNRAAGALILADYLPPMQEQEIIQTHAIALSTNDVVRIVADLNALRKLYSGGQLASAPSLRTGIAVARAFSAGMSGTQAWGLAMLNGLKPSERSRVSAVIGTLSRAATAAASTTGGAQ